jgi:hypothetical protein
MLSYIRPGLLGTNETLFRKKYVDPIYAGLAKDAGKSLREYSDELIQGEKRKIYYCKRLLRVVYFVD